MPPVPPRFSTRFASGPADLRAAARLRYAVFVQEMGGDGPLVDHQAAEERDRFDPVCDQLLLIDSARAVGDQVVGLYRLMSDSAGRDVGFYGQSEFDLTPLLASGRRLLELGRSCLHGDYRGGGGMMHLWQALAAHVQATGVEVLFGVASFPGADPATLAAPLAWLHRRHLAPVPLRVTVRGGVAMDPDPDRAIDARAAARAVPALIKAYLRLGGVVGDGAFVDRAFNTTDVCMMLDRTRLNPRAATLYAPGLAT
jgi:L-ornithine Nalpha-acyltransferase